MVTPTDKSFILRLTHIINSFSLFYRGLPGTNGKKAFETCIVNYVVENKQYDLILGKMEPNGVFTPGLLSIFKGKVCIYVNTYWSLSTHT